MSTPDAKAPRVPPRWFVRARAAQGEGRDRLWQRWPAVDATLDATVARRSTETR